jgi:tripartite-type tricarboxylate transporter receptor subunit TctC
MFRPSFAAGAVTCTLAGLLSGSAFAQAYPTKPIRVICPPGGGTDLVARLLAQGISGPLGVQVIVDNRPTQLTGPIVMTSAPDGHTLLLNGSSFWLAPLLQTKPNYDSIRDFAPITLLTTSPSLLVIHPSLPAKTVKELITLMKSRPGKLDYGSNAPGSPSHLAGELFKSLAGVDFVRIPYKSNSYAITATLSGEVQMTIAAAAATMPHVTAGRLRALAIASEKRSVLAPGMPTVAETVPGYTASSTYGLLAPAGTPAAIINRLNQEVVKFLTSASVKERLLQSGAEVVGSTPEELRSTIASDLKIWGKVIKDAGITAE